MADRVPVHPQEERTEFRVFTEGEKSFVTPHLGTAHDVCRRRGIAFPAQTHRIERRTVTTTAWEAVE